MLIFEEESNVFECLNCGFKTSGIILPNSIKDRRWCPDCHSPLIQCNHCTKRVSAIITGFVQCGHCSKFPTEISGNADIICDSCKKVVNPEALVIKS